MEQCMMKHETKKKTKPPKLPPWPPEPQRSDAEKLDKPTPIVPPRPKHNELSQTQYRLKRLDIDIEANRNMTQSETKEKKPETPVPQPRRAVQERNRTTRHSQRNSVDKQISSGSIQSDAATDTKQTRPSVLTAKLRQSLKAKKTSFISHATDGQDAGDDATDKQATSAKPDLGGRLAGMFWKPPLVTVGRMDSDSEETEEDEKPSEQWNAGIFNGMFKKKPAEAAQQGEEQQPGLRGDLSDSSDNLSEKAPSKEKGGFFSAILRKSPKIPKETPPKQDPEELRGDLSGSTDSLTDNKERGGLFSGFLKKTSKASAEEITSAQRELSSSNDSLPDVAKTKEKGSAFGGMFKKSPRTTDVANAEEPQDDERSLGSDGPSEENNKEKGLFGGFFKKAAKAPQPEEDESVDKKLSASSEDLSEGKAEKDRGLFGVFLKKTPKGERADTPDGEEDKEKEDKEQATTMAVDGNNAAERSVTKDKNLFSNMFKKPQKPAEGDKQAEVKSQAALSGSSENLSENVPKGKKGGLAGIFKRSYSNENLLDEEKGGLFSGIKKNATKASGDVQAAGDKEKSASSENLSENTNAKEKGGLFGGLKKTTKASGDGEAAVDKEKSSSTDNLSENAKTKGSDNDQSWLSFRKQEKSIFSGMFKKAPKAADEERNGDEEKLLSASNENLTEENAPKEKTGGLAAMFKKSPKPAPRSITTKDPLSDGKQEESVKDDLSGDELSGSTVNLLEAATAKEKKGGFAGMFKRTPKTADKQDNDDDEEEAAPPAAGGLKRRRTIKKKRRIISFRVKTTLPRMPKLNASSQAQEKTPVIEESVEMQEMIPAQQSTVEVQPVEMAAYPTEGNPLDSEEENDGLMEWWKNVEGWAEWNETANFQEDDEGIAMEEAADRVYMAARLFVRLFNQRGASLQHCILELLAIADSADQFHKKTVSAAIGGGVASVAGSLTTITGLILAPFTFGASIIVTAVGIGVATAGSITSATANITDAVHSNMDRKKVEKMIQDYQEQIKDIRECMDFVQEGIDTLEEWDFEKYSQSAAKKALNHNIKHVVKEGGRAGKALMINTDKLISTVQVLGAGAGAAKAAQAISVTTGVMSALFLALDVFFLAKDSHELRKGAKTKFATKIRDVCKELQDGLLELNKVKAQLQKTMEGIEVEEYEEIEEVEVEVDDDDLESDPKKLAELEQELDLMEAKLDKRIEEGKIAEKQGESKEKKDGMRKTDKMDKETENRTAAWKEKQEKEAASSKKVEEKPKKDSGGQDTPAKTGESPKKPERERSLQEDMPGRTNDSRAKSEHERGHREDEGKESLGRTEDSKRKPEHERSHRGMTGNPEGRVDTGEGASQERGSSEYRYKPESKMTDSIQAKGWRTETTASRDWDKAMTGESHGRSDERRGSHRSQESSRGDYTEDRRASNHRSHHHHRRAEQEVEQEVRGEEKRMSRIESARKKFETGGEYQDDYRGNTESHRRGSDRDKTGSDRERRGSDRDKTGSDQGRRGSDSERKHSRRGSRHSGVLLDDGLYI